MGGYIGANSGTLLSNAAERKQTYTITTATTSLTGLAYTPTKVHVFHNGVRLVDNTDYTATNGTSITLTNAAQNGDEVVVISYPSFQTSDTVSAANGGTFAGNVAMSGTLGVTGVTTLSDDLVVDTDTLFVDASTNRVGLGTTTPDTSLDIESATPIIRLKDTDTGSYSEISASSGDGNIFIKADEGNGTAASGIRFHVDGSHVCRIEDTKFYLGKTSAGVDQTGAELRNGSSNYAILGTSDGYSPFICNRKSSDGNLFVFRQDNSNEGIISVSGSTVTYGGFSGLHESSGIPTNTPVGTVVSTIDELDVYPNTQDGETHPKAGQTRADHAKVEVSNTVGDSAVYGVVTRFDDDGKVMVGSVGIGSVRVTGACAKGDLLESNGDGTAKVQSDDVVKSKTIGKVTIGNSSTDVKLVSCVLYCG